MKSGPRMGTRHRGPPPSVGTTRKGNATGKPSSSTPRPHVNSRDQQANIRQKEKYRLQVEETLFGDLEGCHVNEKSNPGGNENAEDYDAFKRYIDRKKAARREEIHKGKWLCTSCTSFWL